MSKVPTAAISKIKDNFINFSFVVPAITIFAIFYIYPFTEIFVLSMQDWNGIDISRHWIGLENYKELMTDEIWWKSLWNATYITLFALTFQNILAFMLALACNHQMKMGHFYRVIFFIPPVLSEIVVGLIWRWILDAGVQGGQQIGLLNHLLVQTGFPHLVQDWLSNPETALTCIALVHCWKGFGWGFLLLFAGLQMIDHDLYEAARVDGANFWHTFWNVTVPMMMPIILVVVILTILGSMQAFILILSMVGQGLVYHTEVPVTRILSAMTETQRFGYACAMGVSFGIILIAFSLAMKKLAEQVKQ